MSFIRFVLRRPYTVVAALILIWVLLPETRARELEDTAGLAK